MTRPLCMLALALAAASVTPASHAAPAPRKVCTQAGLTGVWSLKSVVAAEKGVQDFYRQHPVEYMRFTAAGKYDYVARDTPLAGLAPVSASLNRADAADGVTYAARIQGNGMLIIYRDGQPFQGFMCAMEGPVMVWTELSGNPPVRRVQVRVR